MAAIVVVDSVAAEDVVAVPVFVFSSTVDDVRDGRSGPPPLPLLEHAAPMHSALTSRQRRFMVRTSLPFVRVADLAYA